MLVCTLTALMFTSTHAHGKLLFFRFHLPLVYRRLFGGRWRLVDCWLQLVDRRLGSAIRRICFGCGAVRAHLLPVAVTTAREPPSDGVPDATALGTAKPPQGFCGQWEIRGEAAVRGYPSVK